jgi:hypothetical protein
MGIRPTSCSVCKHPERVAIDRAVATGSASFRDIAKRHGVTVSAVSRHVARHLQAQGMATPASVAREVVQAVRQDQEREQGVLARLWERRLDDTYETVRRGMERAEQDPKYWPTVAKFAQAAGSLIDTGMRACGTLAGGSDTRVTVNVEQIIILPTPPASTCPVTVDATYRK